MNIRRLLLVEDNPSDVELTRRALSRHRIGNEMVVAGDGQEALDYLLGGGGVVGPETAPLPALVLLDLKLPGWTVWPCCARFVRTSAPSGCR